MESRFKRYLASLRADRNGSRLDISTPLPAEEHNSNPLFKANDQSNNLAVSVSQDLSNEIRGSEIDGFQASPYTAAAPGKTPIFVGNPVHGNGPVKLQTSRRLATGELIMTQQDHERTLNDIRDGQYIVGKKELRRPSTSQANQQRARRPLTKDDIRRADDVSSQRTPSPIRELPTFRRDSRLSATSSDRGRSRASSQTHLPSQPRPLFLRRSESPSPSRASILSGGEEPNLAVEALWKAENTRLATLFTHTEAGQTQNTSQTAPTSRRGTFSQQGRDSPLLVSRALSPSSSWNSPRPGISPSLSEGASLWSHDPRSNMRSPEPNASREDIRTMIENMRSTYLTAMEAKTAQNDRALIVSKRSSRRRSRTTSQRSPSENELFVISQSQLGRSSGRRSWHGSRPESMEGFDTTSVGQEQPIRKQRSAQHFCSPSGSSTYIPPPSSPPPTSLPPVPQGNEDDVPLEGMPTVTDIPEESSTEEELPSKPALARADSMTLGSLLKSAARTEERSRRSSKRSSQGEYLDKSFGSSAPSESLSDSVRDSLPSSVSTVDFHASPADRKYECLPRPNTTSTMDTFSSCDTMNSISTAETLLSQPLSFPASPIPHSSSSPTPSQTPTIKPETYIYNPDDDLRESLNFDIFFYDNSGVDGAVLRTVKPKKRETIEA